VLPHKFCFPAFLMDRGFAVFDFGDWPCLYHQAEGRISLMWASLDMLQNIRTDQKQVLCARRNCKPCSETATGN
jgi:hypothetical protein